MPKLMAEDGSIELGENIWFFCTANRDETTRDVADKTYDRSHVMELERRDDRRPGKKAALPDVGLENLTGAFAEARRIHHAQADALLLLLRKSGGIGDQLKSRFEIGWGNRLERQVNEFVPVAIAAGLSPKEAMDHVISTKLVRKIAHAIEKPKSALRELKKELGVQLGLDSDSVKQVQKYLKDDVSED